MFDELRLRIVVLCFVSLTAVEDLSAGWFGPSTFAECILDEMKGRPQYMMGTVEDDCRAKFCAIVPPTADQVVEAPKLYEECLAKNEDSKRRLGEFSSDRPCSMSAQGHYECK